jgi:hypothetical protein
MVEPLPRWAKVGSAVVGLVVAVLAVVWWLDNRVGDPEPAAWRVDPAAELDPSTRRVPIVVHERSCASGRSADGRITVSAEYLTDAVRLDVGVRPLGGGQDCQSNPDTPYVAELSEPLGDRAIIGEDWVTP